jgi:CheY-like chemotaxis protein
LENKPTAIDPSSCLSTASTLAGKSKYIVLTHWKYTHDWLEHYSQYDKGISHMTPKIRDLIADDHSILRLGLATFLENYDDMVMVGEAANGQEAVDLCQQLQPDIVLMDLLMPVMDGVTATTIISHTFPQTRIIVLTSTISDEIHQEALSAGAHGYLQKNISVDTLANTIREVAR